MIPEIIMSEWKKQWRQSDYIGLKDLEYIIDLYNFKFLILILIFLYAFRVLNYNFLKHILVDDLTKTYTMVPLSGWSNLARQSL